MKPWPDGRIPYMFDGSHSEEEMQLFRSIVEVKLVRHFIFKLLKF